MPQIKANENRIFSRSGTQRASSFDYRRIKFDAHLATILRRLDGDYF
jgi:hypothetical protein